MPPSPSPADAPASADPGAPRGRLPLAGAHAVAAAVVAAGVLAQVARPLAPDLGPPADPTTWFDPAHLALVESYQRPRTVWGLVSLVVRVALPCLVAFTPPGRRLVERIARRAGSRPALAAAVVVGGVLALTDLVLLPAAFWVGYVHEGAFGFRTQGLGGWARDWVVGRAPGWIAGAALAAGAYALARRLPHAWPPVAALGGAALVAVAVFAIPLVLEPLTLRTEPLPAGAVRDEVERVLASAGEDVDAVLVADASRRTAKVNAYVSGLGVTRRVVLYDTLVRQHTPGEVGLVLAHELGHRRHHDLARGTAGGAAGVVVACYALAWVIRRRAARGRQEGVADPRGAAVALAVAVALGTASLPVEQAISRRAEAAADHAALDITQDARMFLITRERVARANLSDPSPPRWAYLLWHSHPTAAERLSMGERWSQPPG